MATCSAGDGSPRFTPQCRVNIRAVLGHIYGVPHGVGDALWRHPRLVTRLSVCGLPPPRLTSRYRGKVEKVSIRVFLIPSSVPTGEQGGGETDAYRGLLPVGRALRCDSARKVAEVLEHVYRVPTARQWKVLALLQAAGYFGASGLT